MTWNVPGRYDLPLEAGAGSSWFVDSVGGASGNGGTSWADALTTIDAGVNKCAASEGDIVFVSHRHTESVAATDITLDIIGASIVGMRIGRQMPTITLTATGSTLAMSAASTSIRNLRFLSGINTVVAAITVSAADCAIEDCEFRETSTFETVDAILTTAAADRLTIDGWRHMGSAAAGANSSIALVGADDLVIDNFEIYGDFAVAAIDFRTTLSARVRIRQGTIWNLNSTDLAIYDTVGSSTGSIGPGIYIKLADNAANITEAISSSGTMTWQLFDPIVVCNLTNEKGMLSNVTESTDV